MRDTCKAYMDVCTDVLSHGSHRHWHALPLWFPSLINVRSTMSLDSFSFGLISNLRRAIGPKLFSTIEERFELSDIKRCIDGETSLCKIGCCRRLSTCQIEKLLTASNIGDIRAIYNTWRRRKRLVASVSPEVLSIEAALYVPYMCNVVRRTDKCYNGYHSFQSSRNYSRCHYPLLQHVTFLSTLLFLASEIKWNDIYAHVSLVNSTNVWNIDVALIIWH